MVKAFYFFRPLCFVYKLSGHAAKDAAIRLWLFWFVSLVFLRVEMLFGVCRAAVYDCWAGTFSP
ncbi:hypothetical protein EYH65_01420 [Bacillus subtilis]|nr:hypothetical protein C1T29_06650 [Bacillus sp. MBGLi79]NLS39069.1 hypothetical protein [Bacillus subtilis]POO84429.1 hypothetical protein C1T30_03945 [Bacillus sp. MBGLi97]